MIWTKLSRVVIFLLLVAGVLGVAIWYLPLIRTNERIRKANLQLDNQIKHEEEVARQLDVAIRSVRNDPKTVERLAREKLGLIKPGETMIRFEEPRTNAPARR